jgi:hypothetical protein
MTPQYSVVLSVSVTNVFCRVVLSLKTEILEEENGVNIKLDNSTMMTIEIKTFLNFIVAPNHHIYLLIFIISGFEQCDEEAVMKL